MGRRKDHPAVHLSAGERVCKRNFLLRISSATVECERSEFTSLPQVERIILPLSGSLHLFYEGHGEKKLEPFEQDRFDGGWKTVSVGRATDFNVMLREGTQAQVRLLDVNPNEQASVEVAAKRSERGIRRAGNGSGRWKSVAGARTGGRKGRRKLPSDRRQA